MKIAVTSTGTELTSEMDPRFGRAAYFLIIDSATLEFDVIENIQSLNVPQGAGIQAGKAIVDSGAGVLITRNCGPKAFTVLNRAGIDVVTGAGGRVIDVVRQYTDGNFRSADKANVEGHWK